MKYVKNSCRDKRTPSPIRYGLHPSSSTHCLSKSHCPKTNQFVKQHSATGSCASGVVMAAELCLKSSGVFDHFRPREVVGSPTLEYSRALEFWHWETNPAAINYLIDEDTKVTTMTLKRNLLILLVLKEAERSKWTLPTELCFCPTFRFLTPMALQLPLVSLF